ncbi:putative integral membrane protein [Diplodia seriata]|uniref:Putative integral membrane protein n=1 Tax=Diplodia seriata TaxID=420778 RepID=A0A0G2ED15_9PEZI|nr:putative integral membrane protein [Diplodia seriata]
MQTRVLLLTALLPALPLALAHGDDHGMDMGDMAGHGAKGDVVGDDGWPMSYFSYSEHVGLLWTYVALTVLTWVLVAPPVVMLSAARSRLTVPAQLFFLALQALILFVGVAYDAKTPDLYEHNAYNKLKWPLFFITGAWTFLGLINLYADRANGPAEAGQPLSAAVMARYSRLQQTSSEHPRFSHDSGQGTERNSASLYSHSRSPSAESDHLPSPYHDAPLEDVDDLEEKRGFLQNSRVDHWMSRFVPRVSAGRSLKLVRFFYVLIERTILLLGFVLLMMGTITIGGIARGDAVFNILAHYVKGAIFFWYGLLTLGRWMGCFADFGWAWNVKPDEGLVGRWKARVPTAEFTESFVIFLYGSSNVFMEHLAAWGGAWTAQDLEHVSISVMFFGGGALGMLIESKRVRELLNSAMLSSRDAMPYSADEKWEQPKTYRVSLNPMPAMVIMLLGMMMGSHHQASMLSSMVHKQWGNMFVCFAVARAATYLLLYLSPPTSFLPARPPTEIVSSFCLVAGGITFMISNKDTVWALESFDLDAMFTFVLTVGLTALILAWTVINIALKGWAFRREHASSFPTKPSAGASLA